MALSTLDRHLKKQGKKRRRAGVDRQLLAVELTGSRIARENESICGLAVVLCGGRRIEVQPGFDGPTLHQLVNLLERL